MALLRKVKASSESSLNFTGAGELQDVDQREQEGTSQAQDQGGQEQLILQEPDRSDSVVSFSAVSVSLPMPTGEEENEVRPRPDQKSQGLDTT
jgi:hypothetical protein